MPDESVESVLRGYLRRLMQRQSPWAKTLRGEFVCAYCGTFRGTTGLHRADCSWRLAMEASAEPLSVDEVTGLYEPVTDELPEETQRRLRGGDAASEEPGALDLEAIERRRKIALVRGGKMSRVARLTIVTEDVPAMIAEVRRQREVYERCRCDDYSQLCDIAKLEHDAKRLRRRLSAKSRTIDEQAATIAKLEKRLASIPHLRTDIIEEGRELDHLQARVIGLRETIERTLDALKAAPRAAGDGT